MYELEKTTLVMSYGKLEIYGGPMNAITKEKWALIIHLAMPFRDDSDWPVSYHNGGQELFPGIIKPTPVPAMEIDWPDRSTPNLGREFWDQLAADVLAIDGKVLIHCQGGTGRTGTALACLLGAIRSTGVQLFEWEKGDCMVQYVRDQYKYDAIETPGQIAYIKRLGFPVDANAKGSDNIGGSYGKNGQHKMGFAADSWRDKYPVNNANSATNSVPYRPPTKTVYPNNPLEPVDDLDIPDFLDQREADDWLDGQIDSWPQDMGNAEYDTRVDVLSELVQENILDDCEEETPSKCDKIIEDYYAEKDKRGNEQEIPDWHSDDYWLETGI